MMLRAETLPLLIVTGLLVLVVFRRAVGAVLRLAIRSCIGLGFLALWAKSGLAAGLALGVNIWNGLVLGALGVPGLGLLLLLQWLGHT